VTASGTTLRRTLAGLTLALAACTDASGPSHVIIDLGGMSQHALSAGARIDEVRLYAHGADFSPAVEATADPNGGVIEAGIPAGQARVIEVSAWDTATDPNTPLPTYWGRLVTDLVARTQVDLDVTIEPAGLVRGEVVVGGAETTSARATLTVVRRDDPNTQLELTLDDNNAFSQPLPRGEWIVSGTATADGQVVLLDANSLFGVAQGRATTYNPHFVAVGACDPNRPVDHDGDGTACDTDCDDADANNWKACDTCKDRDRDTYFVGCDAYNTLRGPDCDDATPFAWVACATCVDRDRDRRLVGCDAYAAAPGVNSLDCDDADTNNWRTCGGGCKDLDHDGAYIGCDRYSTLPGPDCDDTDANNWVSCAVCSDHDGDGRVVGCDAYAFGSGPGSYDCNDLDAANWASCYTCLDRDGDGAWSGCDTYNAARPQDCSDRLPGCGALDANCVACITTQTGFGAAAGDGAVTLTWNASNFLSGVAPSGVDYGGTSTVFNIVYAPVNAPDTARKITAVLPPFTVRGLTNGVPYIFTLTDTYHGREVADGSAEVVPTATFTNLVAVGAGLDHAVALEGDGAVWAWGDNSRGQLGFDPNVTPQRFTPTRVPGLQGIVAISVGDTHGLALDANGVLWAWGDDASGQLGGATPATPFAAGPVPGLSGVRAFAAGGAHSLATTAAGLFAWGDNTSGQLGTGSTNASPTPEAVPGAPGNIGALAAGTTHSLALDGNGALFAWGTSPQGALGLGNNYQKAVPTLVSTKPYKAIAAGAEHSMAVDTGGQLFLWGSNATLQDQNAQGAPSHEVPTLIDRSPLSTLLATRSHCLAVDPGGQLVAWGANPNGQLGFGAAGGPMASEVSVYLGSAAAIGVGTGRAFSVAVDASGTVWTWGDNSRGQLGIGPGVAATLTPQALGSVAALAAGDRFSAALTAAGALWIWGDDSQGQLGTGGGAAVPGARTSLPGLIPPLLSTPGAPPAELVAIAAGGAHMLGLDSTGQVWAWGDSSRGQLGMAQPGGGAAPRPVPLAGIRRIAAGHTFSLATDGNTLWAWGDNDQGQLGIGSTVGTAQPQAVLGLPTGTHGAITALAAGYDFAVVALEDGSLWGWGNNAGGQAGIDPATSAAPSPVQSPNTYSVRTLSAGASHTLLLDTSSGVVGFGTGADGELFDAAPPAPPPMIPTPKVTASLVAAGNHFSVGADSFTLFAAGKNGLGELGIGTTVDTPLRASIRVPVSGAGCSPALAAGGTAAQAVPSTFSCPSAVAASAAGHHALAYSQRNRQLWAWGANDAGQIGDGTALPRSTPVSVDLGHTFVDVGAGDRFSAALRDDGALYTWGANDLGQLGIGFAPALACGRAVGGNAAACPRASRVPLARSIVSAGVGATHVLAVDSNDILWAWGDNSQGQLGLGGRGGVVVEPRSVPGAYRAVVAGDGFSVALDALGNVLTWGANDHGQLGNGGTSAASSPTAPSGVSGVLEMWAGACNVFARTIDNTLVGWGCNGSNQIGVGHTSDVLIPQSISNITGVRSVCAGRAHTLAVDDAGDVWGWGDNSQGQLGGSAGNPNMPIRLAGLTGMAAVACAGDFSLAIARDGAVWAFGAFDGGMPGSTPGGAPQRLPYRAVLPGARTRGVAAAASRVGGSSHVLLQLGDGSIVGVGRNGFGQLGNLETAGSLRPVFALGL
jgi:alpha-tubulin suppressor-like RCC1 family protein